MGRLLFVSPAVVPRTVPTWVVAQRQIGQEGLGDEEGDVLFSKREKRFQSVVFQVERQEVGTLTIYGKTCERVELKSFRI